MKNKKDFRLHALAQECSQGLQVSATLSDIILEKYLAGILPETRQISIKELDNVTSYKFSKLRKYLGNNYYRVGRKAVKVIADNQFLAEKSKALCKRYVLKLVIPSRFDKNSLESRVEKNIIDTDYTVEETEFIDLMFNELLSVASIKEFSRQISKRDLFEFNSLNRNSFYRCAKKVYNEILQKKLHAGDNIMEYLKTDLADKEIAERLKKSCRFDYFFDKDGILKCDLDTNRNILIKNFINSVLYSFCDPVSRNILLLKLNSKYPI